MGKLEQYKKNNPTAFKTSSNNSNNQERKPVLNLLLKLTGYEIGGSLDTNYVLGKRVDTGEDVKVRLMEVVLTGNYKRPEVSDFADPRNRKKHVPEGNFFVFEQSREESPNVFVSRWAVPLDRDPRGTRAFVMLASLNHRVYEREENGSTIKNEVFKVRALANSGAVEISTVEQFETKVSELLTPKFLGSNPESIVRITDDSNEKEVITIYPEKEEVTGEYGEKFKRVVKEGSQSLAYFKTENTERYELIVAMIEDPDVKVEIIGASVLYPGSATREKLESQHEVSKKHLVEGFYVKKPTSPQEGEENASGEQTRFPEIGYHFCVIGTRMFEDGTPYLTYIKPLYEYNVAESIKDINVFSLKTK